MTQTVGLNVASDPPPPPAGCYFLEPAAGELPKISSMTHAILSFNRLSFSRM